MGRLMVEHFMVVEFGDGIFRGWANISPIMYRSLFTALSTTAQLNTKHFNAILLKLAVLDSDFRQKS